MATYEIDHISTQLFGIVEANPATAYLQLFSDPTRATSSMTIDAVAMDVVANDMELEVEVLTLVFDRYLRGKYRAKTRGVGGTLLGDFCEALVYLHVRSDPSTQIVRVVGYTPAPGQPKKGRFIQPDFLINSGGVDGVLEVKGTQALDYNDLCQRTHWCWLAPCRKVKDCRQRALEQLGYVGGAFSQPAHQLVLKGRSSAFPAGFGMVFGVLAIDGRVWALRGNAPFRTPTPPDCRSQSRDCWKCLGGSQGKKHFFMVEMHNEEGSLPVLGPTGPKDDWIGVYSRWANACWARDWSAISVSANELFLQVGRWIDARFSSATNEQGAEVSEAREALRLEWVQHLTLAHASRGLGAAWSGPQSETEGGRDPGEPVTGFNYEEPPAEYVEWDRFPVRIRTLRRSGQSHRYCSQTRLADGMLSCSVTIQADRWQLRMLPPAWWARERELEPERIGWTAIWLGLTVTSEYTLPSAWSPTMVPITYSVHVGDKTRPVTLGWRVASLLERGNWPERNEGTERDWPRWYRWLKYGDPRARLIVHSDGRVVIEGVLVSG